MRIACELVQGNITNNDRDLKPSFGAPDIIKQGFNKINYIKLYDSEIIN